jgi:hypothetical protein
MEIGMFTLEGPSEVTIDQLIKEIETITLEFKTSKNLQIITI